MLRHIQSLTNSKPCFKEQQSALLRGLITPPPPTHKVQSGKWSKLRLIHTNWTAASWTHNHLQLSQTKVSAQLEKQLQKAVVETCGVETTGEMSDNWRSTILRLSKFVQSCIRPTEASAVAVTQG